MLFENTPKHFHLENKKVSPMHIFLKSSPWNGEISRTFTQKNFKNPVLFTAYK